MAATGQSIRDAVERLEGFEVFDVIGGRVLDHFGLRPLRDYREAEVADPIIRAIVLRHFADEVESGGIHQYLYNCKFDEAVYAKESLELIGEHQLAELLADATALMSDNLDLLDESWQQASELARNPKYQDVEADFREARDQMDGSFYGSYATYIKANLDTFTEFDDPQKCQYYREQFSPQEDPETAEAAQRAFHVHQRLVAWHITNRSLLLGFTSVGLLASLVAFGFGFGVGCIVSSVAVLITLVLYFKWRPRVSR